MKDTDLKLLIDEARAGDARAQKALIERYQADIYRYLIYLSGDPVWSEDLLQETWIRALEHLSKLKDPEAFKPWILRIAGNEFRMGLRKRRERAVAPEEWDRVLGGGAGGATLEALETLQALGRLEPEFREALVLVDVQGHSYGEAAEIIGISENALRSRLHRARKKFEE